MQTPLNALKRDLARQPPILGTWSMSGSVQMAEALGCIGFDFIVVDMEHVAIDIRETLGLLQAIAGTPASALVRLPWNDPVMAKRVLDAGGQTLMFPFVQNAAEAKIAADSCRYPPEGMRGAALINRGSRYGIAKDYVARANREVCCIVQLETREAIARMDEIAAVPGVDALFVGPGDLASSMGKLGQIGDAEVQKELAAAAAKAKQLGKPCGIVGGTPEMVKKFIDYGYSYVAIASDMAMMLGRAGEYVAAMKSTPVVKPASAY